MKKFILEVLINEEDLMHVADCDDIYDAITIEMGWLDASGIFLTDIDSVESED